MITVDIRRGPIPLLLELHTPCRACEKCRSKRARLWAARAADETALATRTWMGTLTLRPEERVKAESECRAHEAKSGVDFDALADQERFALIHARVSAEVTKMVKRLRKPYPPGALRYVCVVERHKDEEGWLHYHILLHERFASNPVRHKTLAGFFDRKSRKQVPPAWPLGFSTWRLVEASKYQPKEQAAYYVAKYLSKEGNARVRASEAYGTGGFATGLRP